MSLKPNWIADNKFLVTVALIAALLVYGVELGSFTLSIDEEVASYEMASWKVWLSQGRWGMALLLKLLPNFTYIPYLATLIFSTLLALSSVYFAKQFFSDIREAAVFVVLFVASPVWLHIAEFNTLSWGVGIGLAACAFSVELFQQKKIGSSFLALVLAGFATAVYQALIIFYAMALLMLVMKDWHQKARSDDKQLQFKPMFLQIVRIGISAGLAIGFYLLVQKTAMYFAHTQITHIGTFVHISEYLENPVATFLGAGKKIAGLLSGTDASYVGWGWAVLLLPWLGCLTCLHYVATWLKKPGVLLMQSAAALLLLFLTFSLVVLAAGFLPLRAVIGFPLLCAASGTLGFRLLGKWPIFRLSVLVYTTVICIWLSAFLFGLDTLARQRDEVMATKISAEIARVAPEHLNVVPVVFVGKWAHQPVQGISSVEIFGTSFFQQDGGNRFRIAMFMRLVGTTNIETRPLTVITPYLPEIDRMPSWPARGSVAQINNIVVVKLSDLSQEQKTEMGF